jgi:hypothetical protein
MIPISEVSIRRFYNDSTEADAITQASTLSLSRALESVRRFACGGLYKAALAKRGECFRRLEWLTCAMCPVPDDHTASNRTSRL